MCRSRTWAASDVEEKHKMKESNQRQERTTVDYDCGWINYVNHTRSEPSGDATSHQESIREKHIRGRSQLSLWLEGCFQSTISRLVPPICPYTKWNGTGYCSIVRWYRTFCGLSVKGWYEAKASVASRPAIRCTTSDPPGCLSIQSERHKRKRNKKRKQTGEIEGERGGV